MHLTYVTHAHAHLRKPANMCHEQQCEGEKDRGGWGQQVQGSRGAGDGRGIRNFLAPIVLPFLEQDKTAIQNDPG